MEDFILREIDRIGELIRGLLHKAGLLKRQDREREACETARTELAGKLDLDIDDLLAEADFIGILTGRYGFSSGNLEQFAELLADLAAAAETDDERKRLAAAACRIYKYLDDHGAPASFNRYYILKELAHYNR